MNNLTDELMYDLMIKVYTKIEEIIEVELQNAIDNINNDTYNFVRELLQDIQREVND